MTMTTFNPFRDLDIIARDFERLLGGDLFRAGVPGVRAGAALPPVNIHETEDAFLLEAELPGVDPATIDISVLRNHVTIGAERKAPTWIGEGDKLVRSERFQGKFSRTVELRSEIEEDRVSAEFKHGVLRVTLPKAASARPRKIAINATA